MILVDQALWSWQGRRWAHLVSDTDLDELHDFANRIGKRRVGFQGDHYDVDTDERRSALELGAIETDSRDLVRALRRAGLRHRGGLQRWSVQHDGPLTAPADLTVRNGLSRAELVDRLLSELGQLPTLAASHLILLERDHEAAALLRIDAGHREQLHPRRGPHREWWLHHEEPHVTVEMIVRHPEN